MQASSVRFLRILERIKNQRNLKSYQLTEIARYQRFGCKINRTEDQSLNRIFPTEDMMISVCDIHKVEQKFQHIYTNGRHKTTGWEVFAA